MKMASKLEADHWQTVFSFLDVDTCENVTGIFPAASEAFGSCVFVVCTPRCFPTNHNHTNKESARNQFEEFKRRGKWVCLFNARCKVVAEFGRD